MDIKRYAFWDSRFKIIKFTVLGHKIKGIYLKVFNSFQVYVWPSVYGLWTFGSQAKSYIILSNYVLLYNMLSNFRTVPLFGRNIFIAKMFYEE